MSLKKLKKELKRGIPIRHRGYVYEYCENGHTGRFEYFEGREEDGEIRYFPITWRELKKTLSK